MESTVSSSNEIIEESQIILSKSEDNQIVVPKLIEIESKVINEKPSSKESSLDEEKKCKNTGTCTLLKSPVKAKLNVENEILVLPKCKERNLDCTIDSIKSSDVVKVKENGSYENRPVDRIVKSDSFSLDRLLLKYKINTEDLESSSWSKNTTHNSNKDKIEVSSKSGINCKDA